MAASAIERAYGFAFPSDLDRFWTIAKRHRRALFDARLFLVGPFACLAKKKPPEDRGRFPGDPPELFTVIESDTGGLHWGYVLHDPGREQARVASFYAREGYPIEDSGPTLLHAMSDHVEAVASDLRDELRRLRAVGERDPELTRSLARIESLALALKAAIANEPKKKPARRAKGVTSLDGLGVHAPKSAFDPRPLDVRKLHAGLRNASTRDGWLGRGHTFIAEKRAGTALLIARDALAILPTEEQDGAVLLARAAYEALGRPLLARTFAPRMSGIEARGKRPMPARIDNRLSRTIAEARRAPTMVERLFLERWRGQPETPDLEEIATFQNLRLLVLRGYPLRDLPSSFAKLTTLRELELFSCELTTIPSVLSKLPQLERLEIIQSTSGQPPKKALLVPRALAFPNLETLSLVGCGLTEVPSFVRAAKKLFKLNLSANRLTTLPAAIGALEKLFLLFLANNALTTLPEELADLSSLRSLGLAGNQIASLPEAFSKLTLETLNVAKNPLTQSKAERARTKKLLRGAKIFWA